MSKNIKVFIAGSSGMVGSSIFNILKTKSNIELVRSTHSELDLTNQKDVYEFFKKEKFDQVYLAAAKVGGIYANNEYPADFIFQNLMIEANVINSAFKHGVKKLLFLGSSCIYPKHSKQPIKEDSLLTGKLEYTNEPYAIAKIAGIKLCESYNRQYSLSHNIDYRSVMPTNLYGPGDNYHSKNSHVIPALIKRFHDAKIQNLNNVTIWGDGSSMREFLYVDDLADACIYIMNLKKEIYDNNTELMQSHINIGSGYEVSIKNLAYTIAGIIGYKGQISYDDTKPSGTPRKLLDSSLLKNLGWESKTNLETGIQITYEDYKKNYN